MQPTSVGRQCPAGGPLPGAGDCRRYSARGFQLTATVEAGQLRQSPPRKVFADMAGVHVVQRLEPSGNRVCVSAVEDLQHSTQELRVDPDSDGVNVGVNVEEVLPAFGAGRQAPDL